MRVTRVNDIDTLLIDGRNFMRLFTIAGASGLGFNFKTRGLFCDLNGRASYTDEYFLGGSVTQRSILGYGRSRIGHLIRERGGSYRVQLYGNCQFTLFGLLCPGQGCQTTQTRGISMADTTGLDLIKACNS